MLEKFLNKNVKITATMHGTYVGSGLTASNTFQPRGVVTKIESDFIELNNNMIIQIKYIVAIEAI